jgi:NADH:ubiquinone oxidoreductase subunit 5 (subunit L)/multisubunit Na+/H+ antiporter MnhA subunit
LAQHDLKRLLAFHSVENIGIILLGLGTGVLGISYGYPTVATLGFAGAALHTLNHAIFKSLLFLGAGSVVHATGTREIDRLGGLAARMPATATAFLVGSAAIVGLPPLNGFLSEWLVFRALLSAGTEADVVRIAALGAVALALIGALALACFAKVVGVLFLGTARDPVALHARESAPGLVLPMLGLATLCIAIGLLPVVVLPPMLGVGAFLAGAPASSAPLPEPAAWPLTVFVLMLGAGIPLAVLIAARKREQPRAQADTWGCGYPATTARMQYTASSFAAPILLSFAPVAAVHVTRTADTFATHPVDPVMDGALRILKRIRAAASRLRPIHRGRLSLSLLYVVATLIALLFYLLFAGHAR